MNPMQKAALERVLKYAREVADINEDKGKQAEHYGVIRQMQRMAVVLDGLAASMRDYDEVVEAVREQEKGEQRSL